MEAIDYSDYLISPPISEEAYRELEATVEPGYITCEPAVLDGEARRTPRMSNEMERI